MHIEYASAEQPASREDSIVRLRRHDPRFARMADHYEDLDKRIGRIELGVERLEDSQLSALKMQRLGLRQDLDRLLHKAGGECCNCGGNCRG